VLESSDLAHKHEHLVETALPVVPPGPYRPDEDSLVIRPLIRRLDPARVTSTLTYALLIELGRESPQNGHHGALGGGRYGDGNVPTFAARHLPGPMPTVEANDLHIKWKGINVQIDRHMHLGLRCNRDRKCELKLEYPAQAVLTVKAGYRPC
jgi:hypothetical protein